MEALFTETHITDIKERYQVKNDEVLEILLDIDFVCNRGNQRHYIQQSAYRLDSENKTKQEKNSLRNVNDSFKKIVIVGNPILVERDNDGITKISIYDFLLKENSLEL